MIESCEMKGCTKQAVTLCNNEVRNWLFGQLTWKGCGKRICEKHTELHHNEFGKVALYHCK